MALMYINSQTNVRMQGLSLWFILSFFMLQGHTAESEAETNFHLGRQQYETEAYVAAIEAFTTAVKLSPETSTYHHWLGKSYGRLAQNSSLLKAYRLASRTREEFERAVALDDKNIDAISDLIDFYLQAPSFLGGGEDKAAKWRRRLEELQQQNSSSGLNLATPELPQGK